MGAAETDQPQDAHHYYSADEVPFAISKYWHQRYNIFSKYDDGIWMTDDAWFGVTPEPVAQKIAEHVATAPKSKSILIDAFAGAGGNTIAFARSGRWNQIFACEKDPQVLACAKHNAEVYGVAKKIWWIQGDVFDALSKRLKGLAKNAVVFGSPPWGGEYKITLDTRTKLMIIQDRHMRTTKSSIWPTCSRTHSTNCTPPSPPWRVMLSSTCRALRI